MKKIFLSTAVLFFAAVLLGGCSLVALGNVYRYSDSSEYEGVVGDFRAENFTSIEIDWIGGDVNIVRRADEMQECIGLNEVFSEAMTEEEYAELGMRTRVKNGVLSVKYASSGIRIPNNFRKSLTITIPASIEFDKIEVNTVSAKVTAEQISLNEFVIRTVSGNVSITDISAKEISVNTVSGDTAVLRAECSGISVDSVSGDFRVDGSRFSHLEFDSTSGDGMITLGEEIGFTCEFDTVSGRFSDEFGAEKRGGKYTFGDGAVKIEVDTTSGNLSLKKATD